MPKVLPQEILRIKKENPIVEFLVKNGHQCKRSGNERHSFLCPFHKETIPSFTVYNGDDGAQNYFCFSCKRSGDIFTLYQEIKSIQFFEALRRLGAKFIEDDYSPASRISEIIEALKDQKENKENAKDIVDCLSPKDKVAYYSMLLSVAANEYWKAKKYDKKEEPFLKSLLEKVDKIAISNNIEELAEVISFIMGKNKYGKSLFSMRHANGETQTGTTEKS